MTTGCALMTPDYLIDPPATLPARTQLRNVPFFAQTAYQCGPAALAMTLNWSGASTDPDTLAPIVYIPGRKGSLQNGLITASRRHGRLAYPFNGLDCLLGEVAAGRPVIVLQNLGLKWIPKWHYAVVVGYDLDSRFVILHTGLSQQRQVGLNTFMRTWQRSGQWGLLTLPVEIMPVCAEAPAYLTSASGLERAGFSELALAAFMNAAEKWPDSVEAAMALGNAQYTQHQLTASVQSFERALSIDPSNSAAMNNLAHILGELGDLEAAESLARKAIDGGGPFVDLYRQTLEEILQKRNSMKH